MMEGLLENISRNSNPKDNFYIVVRGNKSRLKTLFSTPLNGKGYELALVGLSTYYSFPNIDKTNNQIIIDGEDSKVYTLRLPKGCYELTEINDRITTLMSWERGKAIVEVKQDPVTLRSLLYIKKKGWLVKFTGDESLGKVLGFTKETYDYQVDEKGHVVPHTSENIVNILSVNSILIHCDVITGSMVDGVMQPVVFHCSPNVAPGNKIVSDPVNPIYLPVSRDIINELNIWVTDQDNKLLDLQEEKIVITLHIRQR
jgi:hypothetical protein